MNVINQRWILQVAIHTLLMSVVGFADQVEDAGQELVKQSGVQGGLIVHLGVGDGKLTAALRVNDRYQVHGLEGDAEKVQAARRFLRSQDGYGEVSVDQFDGKQLPYIDNLVNLIVADDLGDVSMDEVMRVLTPNGVALIDGKRTIKPRPDNIDDWTHFLHDSTGNPVAHDDVVGPPRHLQWLGSPRWSRHHDRMASMSALVSAGGRIFYVMDEGSRISIQMPPKWMLVARDAFNGTVLWKKRIPTWHNHLWPLKSGPTALARRLITNGETVYVTLGIDAPLTAIDAATGKTIRTFKDTAATEEVIESDGILFALVNKKLWAVAQYEAKLNVGDQARVRKEFQWNEQPRRVVAIDAESGETLWSQQTKVAPLTLAADGQRVYFHNGQRVVCLSRKSGEELWTSEPVSRRAVINFNFGPKLVVYQDVVLYAGGDRSMKALSVKDGKVLWTAPHAQSGYQSPEDIMVSGGLVWNAPTTRTQDTGVFIGRDPNTGDIKSQFSPNVQTYWFHHRCHIAKATDKFLLTSRTGVEFVDPKKEDWDINHWVRGGCLYGIMPCNGLTYAPPHNCACYPEAKLYGLNVLAPASPSRAKLIEPSKENRLVKGPAFGKRSKVASKKSGDWPTYRHDPKRSGTTKTQVPADLATGWETQLGGRLSAPTIADGKLFVAKVDQHSVHALDSHSGEQLWNFTTGGRVDSPPTYHKGDLYFGSADGWVYCVQASNGELKWRFRAAPQDRRLMAFEQLESVWPVHGSVLVEDDTVSFVAGRSNYLDGGLRLYRIDLDGTMLAETVIDELDPATGENLQSRLQVLNMPVGLTDILSYDGKYRYLRSQQIDSTGQRVNIGPHSGQPAVQGSVQRGDTAHLFAPMGFLDDTYFHRAYWVYGRSFAGGHSGYHQAGKYAPSGRILVVDDKNVYGFGRKPQYYRWTTNIEHWLFATSKTPPEQAREEADEKSQQATRRGGNTNMIRFAKTESINPTDQPLAVSAWVNAENPNGVVAARGGPAVGYALTIKSGKPRFVVRTSDESLTFVESKKGIVGTWTHLAGVLTKDEVQLYVDGKLAAKKKSAGLIPNDPAQSLEIGGDDGGPVGTYNSPNLLMGTVDEFRLYHGTLTAEEISSLSKLDEESRKVKPKDATLVLACSFDDGKATDGSGNKNHGELDGNRTTEGKHQVAMRFRGRSAGRSAGSFVKHHWTQDVPLIVRAMVKAGNTLFIAGPPDLMDEEETFKRITERDKKVQQLLAKQNEALKGANGGLLRAVSAKDGSKLSDRKLSSLPVWDGMAAANGRLYLTTTDGTVVSLGKP